MDDITDIIVENVTERHARKVADQLSVGQVRALAFLSYFPASTRAYLLEQIRVGHQCSASSAEWRLSTLEGLGLASTDGLYYMMTAFGGRVLDVLKEGGLA